MCPAHSSHRSDSANNSNTHTTINRSAKKYLLPEVLVDVVSTRTLLPHIFCWARLAAPTSLHTKTTRTGRHKLNPLAQTQSQTGGKELEAGMG